MTAARIRSTWAVGARQRLQRTEPALDFLRAEHTAGVQGFETFGDGGFLLGCEGLVIDGRIHQGASVRGLASPPTL